ncbi:leucine Rich repeat-containing domain protein [Ancylostoma caninum]|uniref:Leucine Rich repeat-containing domain protein n=1 Tax=Ancylostoma caninum TaxID=29170 RepID=A0A368G9N0_ANCCA|nr:leucine Rich repeat-containing domain protein [Ancylostoma caninum]
MFGLNVASNRLERLRDDIFAGLNELSVLRVANNSIDTLEPAAFADLALGDVDLSHNRLTEVPIAIGRLFKLKKIDLSHNKIRFVSRSLNSILLHHMTHSTWFMKRNKMA